MKLKTLVCAALPAAIFLASTFTARAKDVTWTGAAGAGWTTAGNWIGGAPANDDTIIFDSNSTGNLAPVMGSPGNSINKLIITSPAGDISFAPVGIKLTIGGGGIDMSAAAKNLTYNIANTDRLDFTGEQTWDIASGRTFTMSNGTSMDTSIYNIAVNGNVTKSGAGTAVIDAGVVFGANTSGVKTAGTLNITGGTVLAQTSNTANSKVAILSDVTIGNGAKLELKQVAAPGTGGITATGNITMQTGSTVALTGVASTTDLKLSGSGTILTQGATGEKTLAGSITGTAADNVVFELTSGQSLHLTGDNSGFAGTFSIKNGRNVYIDSATAGSASATWNAGNLATGANYIVTASNAAFGAVNLSHNGTFSVESTASNVQIGNVAITASSAGNTPTLTIKGNDTVIKSVTMARSAGANSAFTVSGTGTKVGAITMNDGGVTHTLTVDAGKDLTVTKTGGGTGDFVMNHSGTKTIKVDGTLTVENELVSGNGTVNYNLGTSGVLNAVNHKVNSATATITGGTSNFDTLVFSTFSGSLTLASGRMNIGSGITAGTAGTINLGTATVGAYGNWTGAKDMTLQTGTTTTFDTLDSKDGATARTVTISGALSGEGALMKTGAGTLKLTNANLNSGATTVSGGTLELAGGSLNNSAVSVGTGGTLKVTGTGAAQSVSSAGTVLLAGDLTVPTLALTTGGTLTGIGKIIGNVTAGAGTTIAPGNSPGTLEIQGTADFSGATIELKISAAALHGIITAASIDLTGAVLQIALDNATGDLAGKYQFVDSGSISGWMFSEGDIANVAGLNASQYEAKWTATAGELSIQAIPEPSTYALLVGLAAAGIALVVRRRKRG